jgi:hypothetical protein
MKRVVLWGFTGLASVAASLGLSSVAHAAELGYGAPQLPVPVPQAPVPQVPGGTGGDRAARTLSGHPAGIAGAGSAGPRRDRWWQDRTHPAQWIRPSNLPSPNKPGNGQGAGNAGNHGNGQGANHSRHGKEA